jgi:hypothetical protein
MSFHGGGADKQLGRDLLRLLAITALRFWKTPDLGWWAPVHAALLLLASIAFITFACYGHLLSPSLKF